LRHGADDYVLYPLDAGELDAALGFERDGSFTEAADRGALPLAVEELNRLTAALQAQDGPPGELLDRLAEWVRGALDAKGARIVVEGGVAAVGDGAFRPVLTAPLRWSSTGTGSICLGEQRDGAYTPADAAQLEACARMSSAILKSASVHRQWRRLAMTDDCTGLPNRRSLNEHARMILARAAREKLTVTVLLFDVDDFKSYNDEFGHEAGDEILRVTGELFRKHCREQDLVTRYGGDEFAVVFWDPNGPRVTGSKHLDSAVGVLERIREALGSMTPAHLPPQSSARLTISGGLASYPWDGGSLPVLLTRADEALRAAKKAGKNRVLLVGEGRRS
jgi:diguanylate cyclase (GGDEF)-like protein